MNTDNRPKFVDWATLIFLTFVWGSSFIFIKRGLVAFSPLQVGALRVALSSLVLLPFAISKIKNVKRKDLKIFFIAGLLGNGIPAFLFAIAQTRLDSLMAGILNSLTPVFTLVVGVAFFSLRARWFNILGIIIGLLGAIGLLWSSSNGNLVLNSFYSLAIIAATIMYALNMNIIKEFLSKYDTLTIVSIAFLFIGLPAAIFLFGFTDFVFIMKTHSYAFSSLGFIILLSFIGTSLAVILNVRVIKRTTAVFASSVTYLMPIIAILWGILDGENFLLIFLLWIAVILAGVYMANRR
ncbi:MAG: DMT family transporter [Bacteroidetes bacterium]|nr:DMT family transporter [Bacteroidota bacterium]